MIINSFQLPLVNSYKIENRQLSFVLPIVVLYNNRFQQTYGSNSNAD